MTKEQFLELEQQYQAMQQEYLAKYFKPGTIVCKVPKGKNGLERGYLSAVSKLREVRAELTKFGPQFGKIYPVTAW